MKKISIILALTFCATGCLRNIKYDANPVEGRSFFVSFQEEKVTAVMNAEVSKAIAYRGACTITSKNERVVTIIDLRNTNNVENLKTSVNDGIVLAPGQSTHVPNCFMQPVNGPSTFQIIYKDGEKLLTDNLQVSLKE